MKRTPLSERVLPAYTRREEIANMTTHIIGGAVGMGILFSAVLIAVLHGSIRGILCGTVYGFSMVSLYTVSSIYHGLRNGIAKKVMQVIDHCTIYFLIAGTYTPILLVSVWKTAPTEAWGVFAAEWGLGAIAAVFTAIDHKRYRTPAMFCYIGMGWMLLIIWEITVQAIGEQGMFWLLSGGIFYTLGAILYGIGSKRPVFHTVFHVFVNLGSLFQAVCILQYVL